MHYYFLVFAGLQPYNLLSIFNYFSPKVFAHLFISGDDNSAFLTLLERIRIEALLVNNTLYSNNTAAQQHVFQMLDRINDIGDSENEFNIKSIQFKNSTVNALLLANLVDEVLTNYGGSHGILPNIMLNMSSMAPDISNKISKSSSSIIDMDKYQISKEYVKRANDLFDFPLKKFENKNNEYAMNKLGEGLSDLKDSVYNKTAPIKVMDIVHMQIHPYLQTAFNLKLKQ
jgi:hypothetical protein